MDSLPESKPFRAITCVHTQVCNWKRVCSLGSYDILECESLYFKDSSISKQELWCVLPMPYRCISVYFSHCHHNLCGAICLHVSQIYVSVRWYVVEFKHSLYHVLWWCGDFFPLLLSLRAHFLNNQEKPAQQRRNVGPMTL